MIRINKPKKRQVHRTWPSTQEGLSTSQWEMLFGTKWAVTKLLAECLGSKRWFLGSSQKKKKKKKKGTSRITKSKRQWQSLRGSLFLLQLCPPRDPSPSPAGPSHDPQTSLWRILPREFPRPLVGLTDPWRWSTLIHMGDRECRGDCKFPPNLRGYLQVNLHTQETHAMTASQERWEGEEPPLPLPLR